MIYTRRNLEEGMVEDRVTGGRCGERWTFHRRRTHAISGNVPSLGAEMNRIPTALRHHEWASLRVIGLGGELQVGDAVNIFIDGDTTRAWGPLIYPLVFQRKRNKWNAWGAPLKHCVMYTRICSSICVSLVMACWCDQAPSHPCAEGKRALSHICVY